MKGWKRDKLMMILGVAAMLMLGGCLGKDGSVKGQDKTDGASLAETSEFLFLEDSSDDVQGDNSLDDLQAVLNLPVEIVTEEGEIYGGLNSMFVGDEGCVLFKAHSFKNGYADNWSGVSGVTAEGEPFSLRLEVEPGRISNQLHAMGPVSGKKGYIACYYEYKDGKPSKYWFYELDENFQKTRCVEGKLGIRQHLDSVMEDAEGNIHVTFHRNNGMCAYAILSPEGEKIFEADLENRMGGWGPKTCTFEGGRVAICDSSINFEQDGKRFYEADLERGTLRELTVSKEEKVINKMKSYIYCAAPVSDTKVAWCDRSGIYVYDAKTGKSRAIYQWSNHGIFPKNAYCLGFLEDGSVGLLYDTKEGLNYLLLKPTEERKELPSVTIAVSPYNREKYEVAATYFKKAYPGYAVILKDDYDETSLLTQLGAGTGPVLVDTELTGFENLEHLWQPLDGFLEQTRLAEEMIPKTLEFGKIGGVTYGIVRDFYVDTLIASEGAPSDWDYGGFLDALEKWKGAAFTYEGITASVDWREHFFDALQNGLEDNYYFDAATGESVFGTKEFERVLRLSKKAAKCPPPEDGKALREGEVLCETAYVLMPAMAFRLRRRLEADGEQVVGYPTKEGGRHYLVAQAPLAMRSTATDEEKKIAYTFLRVYLSAEAMRDVTLMLPVRKDVFEEQINSYERTAKSAAEDGTPNASFMPVLDREADLPFLYGLIENGVVRKSFPTGLQSVFDEEFGDYLAGRIDGAALSEHLRNRTWLYLEEQK